MAAKKKPDDAWKQHDDLIRQYTDKTKVRADIEVVARAVERGVEVRIGRRNPKATNSYEFPQWLWSSTGKRNVNTMRELAAAIVAACDFVDESNPVWASKH